MTTRFESHLSVIVVGVLVLCVTVAHGDDSGRDLLGWWGFDEETGVYSADAVDPVGEAAHTIAPAR